MKIVAVNGGPRKGKNTDQMLDAFIEGVKEANPEADVQVIRLYDYQYTGCRSCFACQLKNHRDDLQCWVKDDITQLLKDTYHADGIVFASPIYYSNVSAQLRSFWERLLFPGPSGRNVPTAVIYTMNMNEEQCNNFIASPLNIISKYLIQCFHVEPEVVSSFNTFQYNANENFTDGFRAPAKAKWLHHEEQFATDLENARQAGKNMVAKING
jgi:multimeric flavodoxin WrbA